MVDVNVTGVPPHSAPCLKLVSNKGHVIQIGSIAARNVFPNSGFIAPPSTPSLPSVNRCAWSREDLVTTINPGAVNTAFITKP